MIGYVECFDSNNTMPFKVTDKKLLKIILKYGKSQQVNICKICLW